jgi:hypothetical protein
LTSPIRRRLRSPALISSITAATIVVGLIATTGAADSQSQATVILSTSVSAVASNGRAIVTATVKPGSLVPRGGTVKFVDRTNHRTLGTAVLQTKSGSPCTSAASSCQARLSVAGRQLVRGANRIVGYFNPQRLYYPSFRGGTWLYRGVSPTCHSRGQRKLPVFTASPIAHAARGGSICRGTVRDPRAKTSVVVSTAKRSTSKNTVIAFGAQNLPCSTRGTGDLLAYSVGGSQAPGDFALETFGKAATIANRAHPKGYMCYESTIPFRTASGARAKQTENGSYYGSLPHCGDNDHDDVWPVRDHGDDQRRHPAPCIEWEQYSHRHGTAVFTTWVEPTTGDPLLHH